MEFLKENKIQFLIIYLIFNIVAFLLYFMDKQYSIKKKNRISEKTLLTLSAISPIGAIISMLIFRHKTKKLKFKLVYIFLFLHIVLFIKFLEYFN